jgi:hypothetical protein
MGVNDFVEYWAAARLLLTGFNPYSPEQLFVLQRSVGWAEEIPLIMWNPPWVFVFILPFGLLDFAIGQFFWLLLHSTLILYCGIKLWHLHGGPVRYTRIAWIATFTFFPTYIVLLLEQIGPMILFGVVGFLHFQKQRQWGRAGAMLPLIAIKPHLVYLLWIALLFWVLEHRQWKLVFGAFVSGVFVILVPITLNSAIFNQYLQLHLTAPPPTPFDWSTPTIGRALREFFVVPGIWLQLLPTLLGMLWFTFFWRRHRQTWDWIQLTPLLLLVSVATTFFAWTLDQVILLPAIVQGAVWLANGTPARIVRSIVALYFLITVACVAVKFFSPYDFWYFWLAPSWLLLYLLLRKKQMESSPNFTPA